MGFGLGKREKQSREEVSRALARVLRHEDNEKNLVHAQETEHHTQRNKEVSERR